MKAKGKAFKYGANVDTDVIIPARYLNTAEPSELAAHCMEDIDKTFVSRVKPGDMIVAGPNFGCGSSREHAPWALEVNDINVVIAENFARIFRQNMYNCGMFAIEMPKDVIDYLFKTYAGKEVTISVDVDSASIRIQSPEKSETIPFAIGGFDKTLVKEGGWVGFANKNY